MKIYPKTTIFLMLLLTVVVTFFTRNDYRGVDNIDPQIYEEPTQEELEGQDLIKFEKDDFKYELTPLYNYDISGLVVSKMDYTLLSIYKRDSVFPMDLCMIWGENVSSEIYKSKSLKFSQDMRFCFFKWKGNIEFDPYEVSNNHLILNHEKLEKKIKQINEGDQVRVKGKLVDVKATNLGEPGEFDPEYFEWGSSISRDDTGGGACETIFIEEVEIIEKGNPIASGLFRLSSWGMLFYLAFIIFSFVVEALHTKKEL